ncbi:MAG: hypothetical protein MUC93_13905 [Bacteroidales bacterium]|jgi:hypothetical protein|nr:hypothetical protein [Bacteroidales bacterium]
MEKRVFLLEPKENSRIVNILQIIFGIICIIISIYWIIFNIRSLSYDPTHWITIAFLVSFGTYQILAGSGKTLKYIETGSERIVLKQNSLLPRINIGFSDLERIEFFPLNINFYLKNSRKITLRFGTTYTEIIGPVEEAVIEFAEFNKIPFEVKREEL